MNTRTTVKLFFVAYIVSLVVSCATCCQAQFNPITPDCCSQAITLSRQVGELTQKLQSTKTILDSTRAVGDRLIDSKDDRITQAVSEANRKLTTLSADMDKFKADRARYKTFLEDELMRSAFLKWGLHRRMWKKLRELNTQ